mmetsp:Transcript_27252/g.59594  ORF Transcript_27252/g.59594 Transcript_27252/m.59594 type:complete len:148 (-) Transcript_27252:22-465(-)
MEEPLPKPEPQPGRRDLLTLADAARRKQDILKYGSETVARVEARLLARWEQEVHQLAPQLRQYGNYMATGAISSIFPGLPGIGVPRSAPAFSENEPFMRFAQPVLEPFLEGTREPTQRLAPLLVFGVLAYSASCVGLGFCLGSTWRL